MEPVDQLRDSIVSLLRDFNTSPQADLRQRVLALVPVWRKMNQLGSALLPSELRQAARDRLLFYFRQYPQTILSQEELAIVAGISEWARRVRELRVERGWAILSGKTIAEMIHSGDIENAAYGGAEDMRPDDYVIISPEQDKEAAYRWQVAKDIRNKKVSAKAKVLEFLRENAGIPVSGEELRYVAKDATEWARRVRELRTEHGWPVSTHWSGRPELRSGMYLLEEDRQLPPHDRRIPDATRREVMIRDNYSCQDCGWTRDQWTPDDPRHLELHHQVHHVQGGSNTAGNLVTLCKVCHDLRHAK